MQGKSTAKGVSSSQASKQDRKSPVASPKLNQAKDHDDGEEQKSLEANAPKVPPLKIVIPGGASGSGGRNEQEEGAVYFLLFKINRDVTSLDVLIPKIPRKVQQI